MQEHFDRAAIRVAADDNPWDSELDYRVLNARGNSDAGAVVIDWNHIARVALHEDFSWLAPGEQPWMDA